MAQYNGKVKVDVGSPEAFYNATNGNGYNFDYAYGDQCWDGFALFNWSAYEQGCPTGNGYARGCWEINRNWFASHGFILIEDKNQLKNGDWVIFGGTVTGHVGMYYNGKIWGQNQQGNGSGYPFTLISMSFANFLGAFRPDIWKDIDVEPEPEQPAEEETTSKKKIILPIGITLAALAAGCGLTIPQLLQGDPGGTLEDINPEQVLTDDQAKDAAEAAAKAVEQVKGKTPEELAKDRCGDGCKAVTVEKWNGTNNGTIWNICKNESTKDVQTCVEETIANNTEIINITAAEHNLPGDGHWIFPGEVIWIK